MFELHTSDFDPCPGRAMLRREGKFDGVAGTALVRGLVAHSALELLYKYPEGTLVNMIRESSLEVCKTLEAEGRSPSDAVESNLGKIEREIGEMLEGYRRRLIPLNAKMKILGTEVPVFWNLGDGHHLSSHIDLLMWDESTSHVVAWDWKWRKDALAISDLSRNMQLACYWALLYGGGQVQIEDAPDSWVNEGTGWFTPVCEDASVSWVDLTAIKPYTRATTTRDDDGQARTYKKGDDRPISRIVKTANYHPSQVNNIKRKALERIGILTGDSVPFIPQGCSHCECEPWCPRFDMPCEDGFTNVTF
jgi:hypothetical protein